jgi:uncharacterized protein (DUF1697 family)
MALIVFLRGVNVGGHRILRPSLIAKRLRAYDVVNVGAAGTFVIRRPGPQREFLTVLKKKLPFTTQVICCNSRDLLRLETKNPFVSYSNREDTVRFVTLLSKAGPARSKLVRLPKGGRWFVKVVAVEGRFIFGLYRRHMKTIGYLGQFDKLYGTTATTRS